VGTEYIQGVGKVRERLIILLDLTMVITGDEKAQLENAELSV
jgi:chemotaxis signal transduction protein